MKPAPYETRFTRALGIAYPIVCGPMYPCSNPELVAAVSEAGGLGVVQPLSLTFVYKYDFRDGLRHIRSLTQKPIGLNLLIESSSQAYLKRMERYLEVGLEEGVKFFITALGSPGWVVKKAHAAGAVVYHDVTEKKWAERAVGAGVDGLICVNRLAGGHAGTIEPERLIEQLKSFNLPLVAAGGVGDEVAFKRLIDMGYDAVQMGTRFVATSECKASESYKQAIVEAKAEDVVLTERLTGVPVAVLLNDYVKREGTHAGWLARRMLRHPRFKHWARIYYSLKSFKHFRDTIQKPKASNSSYSEYWQAGKSVAGIDAIEPAAAIVERFAAALVRS